jgi:hypothetical protein
MRTLLLGSAALISTAVVGLAIAARPASAQVMRPPALQHGGACFERAMAYDRAVTAMGDLKQAAVAPSPKVEQATEIRNLGIEACLAGRVRDGVQMIDQAIDILTG